MCEKVIYTDSLIRSCCQLFVVCDLVLQVAASHSGTAQGVQEKEKMLWHSMIWVLAMKLFIRMYNMLQQGWVITSKTLEV